MSYGELAERSTQEELVAEPVDVLGGRDVRKPLRVLERREVVGRHRAGDRRSGGG